ncbi:glutamine synthetase [Bradyrhizobium sp. 6(2017)]|nr:glutamine synthetase [Bradyrhizobium sp. 6(2017)]
MLTDAIGVNPTHATMIGVSDFDGVLRGKHILQEDVSDRDGVIKFSEAVLAWDCSDRVIPAGFTQKPLSAFGDADLRILSSTGRAVSYVGDQRLYLAEFTGAHEGICPRGVLRKFLRRAANHGYSCAAGFEFEFMLFKENADTIEEKPFDKWVPLTSGPFGYSIARSVAHQELFGEILVLCDKARIPLIGLHFETGPGVIEASLHDCDALEAADRAIVLKS